MYQSIINLPSSNGGNAIYASQGSVSGADSYGSYSQGGYGSPASYAAGSGGGAGKSLLSRHRSNYDFTPDGRGYCLTREGYWPGDGPVGQDVYTTTQAAYHPTTGYIREHSEYVDDRGQGGTGADNPRFQNFVREMGRNRERSRSRGRSRSVTGDSRSHHEPRGRSRARALPEGGSSRRSTSRSRSRQSRTPRAIAYDGRSRHGDSSESYSQGRGASRGRGRSSSSHSQSGNDRRNRYVKQFKEYTVKYTGGSRGKSGRGYGHGHSRVEGGSRRGKYPPLAKAMDRIAGRGHRSSSSSSSSRVYPGQDSKRGKSRPREVVYAPVERHRSQSRGRRNTSTSGTVIQPLAERHRRKSRGRGEMSYSSGFGSTRSAPRRPSPERRRSRSRN